MTAVREPRCVVAIGASAGGLAALESLFRRLPDDTGHAYVVVQHLSPNFKSVMSDLLSGFAHIPAVSAEDGMMLAPNRIHLIPPGKDLELSGLRLRVIERSPHEGLHLPVDRFFSSLARQAGERSVGIVLSGSGSDGSRGIADIQRAGGRVFVQSMDSAAFDGMPKAAARAATAAKIDTPEGIADALQRVEGLDRLPDWNHHNRGTGPWLPADAGELTPVFRAMIARFDLDFSEYKSGTVGRRIDRRLKARNCPSIQAYADLLMREDSEVDALWRDLLIGVTHFFRDPEAFETLEKMVIPQLLAGPLQNREVRVWVAGCATGEEAYSLAILLDEAIDANEHVNGFRIFATDIHRSALERASAGYFQTEALEHVSAPRLARYFEPRGDGFVVSQELRRRVVFAEHNILTDPPFTRLDLVTCRNLLIYLLPAAQNQVLSKFEFSLRPTGMLFLGPSESLMDRADSFESVHGGWRVFKKKGPDRLSASVEPTISPRRWSRQVDPAKRTVLAPRRSAHDPEHALSRVFERYVPSGFLVDEQRTLLHVFGEAGRYIRVQGPASLDIVSLVHAHLQLPLTTAIHRALKENRSTHVTAQVPDSTESIGVDVDVLGTKGDGALLLFVRLQPHEARRPVAPAEDEPGLADIAAQRIRDLEEELAETSTNLQSVVEELETSNEELQATNEELLASNQELQSTNEELQSVNEELHTVNAEHERKNEELTELTTDLTMLMECTSIGMVFLGPRLEIRKFTPAIDAIFPLKEQDIGRPLADITHGLAEDDRDLLGRAGEVLRSGELNEREVMSTQGVSLLERIHPYRGPRGDMRGVAVSYVDLTSVRRAEAALRRSEALNRSVLNALAANVAVIDRKGTIIAVNGRWTDFAESNEAATMSGLGPGTNYLAVCLQAADSPEHLDAHRSLVGIQGVLSGRSEAFEYVYPCHSPTDKRWFLMRATPLDLVEGGAVIAHIDVTELERLRQDSMRTAKELQRWGAAVTAAADGIFVCNVDGTIDYGNPSFERMVGCSKEELRERDLFSFDNSDGAEVLKAQAWPQIRSGKGWTGEIEMMTGDRESLQVELTLAPITTDGTGEVDQVVGVQRDVTEQRAMERRLRNAQKMEAIGTLAGGIAHDFNNMLVAIIGYAYLLTDAVRDNPSASEDLRQIERASARARDLVDQILTFSRTTAGKVERVQLQNIVAECMALLRGSIPSSVDIRTSIDCDDDWVEADATQLHQVVMNLATNAYQAIGDDGGRIEVGLSSFVDDGGGSGVAGLPSVLLTVQDNGPGIEDSVRDRIFEPFFTTKSEGTGMGLSVVHGIVSRLGGRIEVTSQVGSGSMFTVVLPATTPPTLGPVAVPSRVDTGSERVYVVDDEPALVALVRRMLEPLGYPVETFTSGRQVLERMGDPAAPRPDLLLLDHAMPKMTGTKLVAEIRRLGIQCPAILVSGAAPTQDRNFAAILRKPFTRDALVACVRTTLDG